jgi:hypothetical protein
MMEKFLAHLSGSKNRRPADPNWFLDVYDVVNAPRPSPSHQHHAAYVWCIETNKFFFQKQQQIGEDVAGSALPCIFLKKSIHVQLNRCSQHNSEMIAWIFQLFKFKGISLSTWNSLPHRLSSEVAPSFAFQSPWIEILLHSTIKKEKKITVRGDGSWRMQRCPLCLHQMHLLRGLPTAYGHPCLMYIRGQERDRKINRSAIYILLTKLYQHQLEGMHLVSKMSPDPMLNVVT